MSSSGEKDMEQSCSKTEMSSFGEKDMEQSCSNKKKSLANGEFWLDITAKSIISLILATTMMIFVIVTITLFVALLRFSSANTHPYQHLNRNIHFPQKYSIEKYQHRTDQQSEIYSKLGYCRTYKELLFKTIQVLNAPRHSISSNSNSTELYEVISNLTSNILDETVETDKNDVFCIKSNYLYDVRHIEFLKYGIPQIYQELYIFATAVRDIRENLNYDKELQMIDSIIEALTPYVQLSGTLINYADIFVELTVIQKNTVVMKEYPSHKVKNRENELTIDKSIFDRKVTITPSQLEKMKKQEDDNIIGIPEKEVKVVEEIEEEKVEEIEEKKVEEVEEEKVEEVEEEKVEEVKEEKVEEIEEEKVGEIEIVEEKVEEIEIVEEKLE